MKKFLFIFVILAVGSIYKNVYADSLPKITYDSNNDVIKVSGTIDSKKSNIPLTVTISKNSIIYAADEAFAKDMTEDGLIYSFPDIILSDNAPSGQYTVDVSGYFIDSMQNTFLYTGADRLFELLGKINKSINENDFDETVNLILTNATELNIDVSAIKSFKDISDFKGMIVKKTYDLPLNIDTETNKATVKEKTIEFRKYFDECSTVSQFNHITSIGEFNVWYENNLSKYNLDKDDSLTQINEEEFNTYFKQASLLPSFSERISKEKNLMSINDVKAYLTKISVLSIVKDSHFSVLSSLIEKFPQLFSINYSRFNLLSINNKSNVCSLVCGKDYDDCSALSSYIDQCVDNVSVNAGTSGGISSGGSSSGGSSGGWGSSTTGPITTPVITEDNIKNKYFIDMDSYQWADEAVKYLFDKGIVSGKGENIFAPSDPITRAEFIKMVVLEFGISVSDTYDKTFSDVNDEWYAKYVYAASKASVANGYNNMFNPDDKITRQDMAVILMHAMNSDGGFGVDPGFEDQESISGYAVEAVTYLYKKGIVNGVGDNKFAPKANATRAEAAKMIYGASMNYEKN